MKWKNWPDRTGSLAGMGKAASREAAFFHVFAWEHCCLAGASWQNCFVSV
ncbi:hypothetical protein GMO_14530 [Gluconobacter morbifer G707]|uniref:Uncharacterized protein n=1 Tax=Gluconobacter morbifer G707 TaxID=1088869 RepID=G6XIP3_9PROT|nr:hypothetical protein GMO_14530 [Gluconobacter morbifer G707]